jgi:uncharacterized membrane protein YhiD involved in acid resistance
MFELFTSREYYEFPSFQTAIFSFLLSFVLSMLVALTYQVTERGQGYSKNFFQALVLGSIVTAMVLMAIGDSIARGLGILGAIAIIRFRARVNSPRNILFIFAALSIGIATGVYGYRIAVAGTLSFCAVALLLRFSGYGRSLVRENRLVLVADRNADTGRLEALLQEMCEKVFLVRMETTKKEIRLRYRVTIRKEITRESVTEKLLALEGVSSVRVLTRENTDAI